MDSSMEETTSATISLLETRLLRIEQVLHGRTSPSPSRGDGAAHTLAQLEKRFAHILSEYRVYAELLKIYKVNPGLFHSPNPSEPPSQLNLEAIQSIVLASASSYPATVSALTAIKDSPIPDPADSASLIALSGRMNGIQATQVAQAAEVAELRGRSENIVRAWYEGTILQSSHFLAEMEGRVEKAERQVRRAERARDEETV